MTDPVTLFCLVDREGFDDAFSVKIDRAETVSVLKELIADKTQNDWVHRHIRLWKVSIPDGDQKALEREFTDSNELLRPVWKISKAFPEDPPEETIHIMVQDC